MRCWNDKIIGDITLWKKNYIFPDYTLILTNGCFDLLHVGHINFLQEAKRICPPPNLLIVAVNSDKSVKALKGNSRPFVSQEYRLTLIAALEAVDFCFIFDSLRCDQVITQIKPHIWVKGGDYTLETLDATEREAAEKVKADIKILPLNPGFSTTNLAQNIVKNIQKSN